MEKEHPVEATDKALLTSSDKRILPAEGEVAGGAEHVLAGGAERVLAGGATGETFDDLAGGGMITLGVRDLP